MEDEKTKPLGQHMVFLGRKLSEGPPSILHAKKRYNLYSWVNPPKENPSQGRGKKKGGGNK